MEKTQIYSYVLEVTNPCDNDFGKWKGVCISENGNIFRSGTYLTSHAAIQDVFQNVKCDLNERNERHGCDNWYEIIETTAESEEIKEALKWHNEFSNPSSYQTVKYKIQVWWLISCVYGRYAMEWVRYFKGLFVSSK